MERRSGQRNEGRGVERTLLVLEVLAEGDGVTGDAASIALADIATRAGLPKSTVHRIVQTLVSRGYAASDGDGRYELGPQILRLAGLTFAVPLDLGRRIRPLLEQLCRIANETVHFGVFRRGDCFYAEKIEPIRPYRMASMVGMRIPLHSTAIGKTILSHLPQEERTLLLGREPLVARTSRTLVDMARIDEDLRLVRERGFSLDDEEDVEGIRCVAAPVFGNLGRVIGGISVSAPTFNMSLDDATTLAPTIISTAREASLRLGANITGWSPSIRHTGRGDSGGDETEKVQ